MRPQLQVLWQTTGEIFKHAFSPLPSPRSSDSSTLNPETSSPLPSPRSSASSTSNPDASLPSLQKSENIGTNVTSTNELPLRQVHRPTQTTAINPATHGTDANEGIMTQVTHIEAEGEASPNLSSRSSEESDDTSPSYVSASTQTGESSSQTDYTPSIGEDGSDPEKKPSFDDSRDIQPPIQHPSLAGAGCDANEDKAPEVLDGPSQVIVANHNNKDCLAILVTKDMVEYLNNIAEDTRKVERLEAKFADAERKVNFARINIEYCESLLKDAKSQQEIDDLGKDIKQRQSALPRDDEHREMLECQLSFSRANLNYSQARSRSMLQELLGGEGLLQTFDKQGDEEADSDEDGERSQRHGSQTGYEADSICSGYSDISIEELAKRAAKEEVKERYDEFLEAERNFETRDQAYAYQKRLWQERVRQDPNDPMTPTVFDLCFIEEEQELTRNLAVAEDAYEEALARGRRFGPNQWRQESGFITDEDYGYPDDGYDMSQEVDEPVSALTDYIYDWMESISAVEFALDVAKLDLGAGQEFGHQDREDVEVCDIRSAGLSDAVSSRDITRMRRRIDRWRAMTGREK